MGGLRVPLAKVTLPGPAGERELSGWEVEHMDGLAGCHRHPILVEGLVTPSLMVHPTDFLSFLRQSLASSYS